MPDAESYVGLLVIGDPHLEGRVPGFRKDDYPRIILEKLQWGLDYAKANRLLPALLGDLFDKPRDNPTWMVGSLLDLLAERECLALYGNHDCADPELSQHDSLSLLTKSGRLRLLDGRPWRGTMNGRPVIVGGSSYRQQLPERVEVAEVGGGAAPLVIWLTHHDIMVPGYIEQGRIRPREIEGVDLVINGHIHRRLEDVKVGRTTWMTPGNISRRSRSDASRDHIPAMARIDVTGAGFARQYVEVPHRPFDDVFHSIVIENSPSTAASAFVTGLAELMARRTQSGAGLSAFLEKNLGQFEPPVADEIAALAKEITEMGKTDPAAGTQTIEQLQKRYRELHEKQIKARTQRDDAADRLDKLKAEAREKYGTDDVGKLQEKLSRIIEENATKRAKYQEDLDSIEKALAAVEEKFSDGGSSSRREGHAPG